MDSVSLFLLTLCFIGFITSSAHGLACIDSYRMGYADMDCQSCLLYGYSYEMEQAAHHLYEVLDAECDRIYNCSDRRCAKMCAKSSGRTICFCECCEEDLCNSEWDPEKAGCSTASQSLIKPTTAAKTMLLLSLAGASNSFYFAVNGA